MPVGWTQIVGAVEELVGAPTAELGRDLGRMSADQKLAKLHSLPPETRWQALRDFSPSVRDRLLNGPDISGPAFRFDWSRFDGTAATYHPENAWGLAIVASRIYQPFGQCGTDPKTVGKCFADMARAGFRVQYFGAPGASTQAAVLSRGNTAIVAFRGTEPEKIKDLLRDADACLVECRHGGREHSGFQKARHEVLGAILAHLGRLEAKTPGLSVFCTGHSLGAALAIGFAMDAAESGHIVAGVYPFAAPRAGNREFADSYRRAGLSERTWRFRNNNDIVTTIPPEPLYHHVGQQMYFTEGGRLLVNPPDDLIKADRLAGMATLPLKAPHRNLLPESISDHAAAAYVKQLYLNQHVTVSPA
jgi:triacylglycerol lipase